MPAYDPRIDAYIATAPEFTRPILSHLRRLVHEGCPGDEETMKWSRPNFTYRGMLCGMAAFTSHCTFDFWNSTIKLPAGSAVAGPSPARITSLTDLPPDDTIIGLVREAARLNEAGVKRPTQKRPRKPLTVPPDLKNAILKNPKAAETFENLSPSHKREYIEWIVEAKGEETRARRVVTAVEWMAEGKPRNWKYMKR